MFDVPSDAKELRRHLKRVKDCPCLATASTHDALSREGFQKEKPRIADESSDASAVVYKKNIPSFVREQMLSTASGSFF